MSEGVSSIAAGGRLRRDLAGAAALARDLPAPVLLGVLVLVSFGVLALYGSDHPAPWIYGDEIIYGLIARGFADFGDFTLRGDHTSYGIGYPLLLAPAYALTDRVPDAYALAKTLNALYVSLSAVPVYLLARRGASQRMALLAAGLTLALPAMALSATIMTENALLPLVLVASLLFVRALESPTVIRQLVALVGVGPAYLVKPQALALIPAFVAAIAVDACLAPGPARPRLRSQLVAFRATWLALVAAAAVGLAALVARGDSPATALGAYRTLAGGYSPLGVVQWMLYHLAELDIYLGVVPLLALPLALRLGRTGDAHLRALVAVSASVFVAMLLVVAAFASSTYGVGELHERNLVCAIPLVLVLFVVWLDRGAPRPRRGVLLGVALTGALLPALIPNEGRGGMALLPWYGAASGWTLRIVLVLFAAVLAGTFAYVRNRHTQLLAGLVVASMLVTGATARAQFTRRAHDAAGPPPTTGRDWVDASAGDGNVLAVLDDRASSGGEAGIRERRQAFLRLEFFNRSVRRVMFLGIGYGYFLPDRPARLGGGGTLLDEHGAVVRARLVAVPCTLRVKGSIVARDERTGIVLYSASQPIRIVPGAPADCFGARPEGSA